MGVKNKNKGISPAVGGGSFASTAAGAAIRTPWGVFDATRHDEDTRDPFEPDDPIVLYPNRDGGAGTVATSSATGASPEPMSPRELYEMLISPAARTSRTSPARTTPGAASAGASAGAQTFPPQADMVLSALEAGHGASPQQDRRGNIRRTYRVGANLRFHSDQPGTAPRAVYTRDIHSRGVGFITQHRLPLGYGGVIELPDPKGGAPIEVSGTLLRCREAASGWFEGSLYFSREHPAFDQI